jgi:16S rRNA (guanine966-N2)-methyltransferase
LYNELRIVAGRFKQRKIKAPKGENTRPTSGKVREALFSILFGRLEGAVVLDLFAGSGALALEAISRGADYAVICDNNKKAVSVISDNIKNLGIEDNTRVLAYSWEKTLEIIKDEGVKFDIIFLDPPYGLNIEPILQKIFYYTLLKKDGIISIEHDIVNEINSKELFAVIKEKRYRNTAITFLKQEDQL